MTGLENEGAARLVADIELFDKRTPKHSIGKVSPR